MVFVYIGIGIVAVIVLIAVVGKTSSSDRMPEDVTDGDIRNLAQQGRKIQAIKWYRSLHGVDLKAAKEAVEEMLKES